MMTIEEKAKAYDEALTKMQEWKKKYVDSNTLSADGTIIKDLEEIFPELRESEDERVIKTLYHLVKDHDWINGATKDECVSWLEKQKEQNQAEGIGTDGDIMQYIEEGEKRGIKEVISFPDKYGLQKPAEIDERKIINKHITKEVISTDVYTRLKECGWRVTTSNDTYSGYAHCWSMAEKQDYSGLTDFERAIHRGFLCAGVENVPVTIIKETAQDCLSQKKAEWSEEDKETIEILKNILEVNHPNGKFKMTEAGTINVKSISTDEVVSRLESLRPQPHWKPSEDQMKGLKFFLDFHRPQRNAGTTNWREYDAMESLYEQLIKLIQP